jgi:hypothetical protein
MGELKKCPADFMAYVKKLPRGQILLDDIAQVVWLWSEDDTFKYEFTNNKPFPMSYSVFLAHKRR